VERAIEVLMGEHRLIEQALGSLETYAVEIRAGAPVLRDVIADYAAFLRGFADELHHGKEEDILFQRLIDRGFAREAGPLAVMYHEHELGRSHVRGLSACAASPDDIDARVVLCHADAYVPLLRQHILKEDRILYPMALQVLTSPELDAMNTEFEVFDRRMNAIGARDQLQALADRLTGRFRPAEPVRMTAPPPTCARVARPDSEPHDDRHTPRSGRMG
jgi:hemerythrin-like domain-containing protein